MDGVQISASVLPEFIDLYEGNSRYIVYYSGRSTGKSYAVADSQITRALSQRLKFLDGREFQSSIRDSVKSLLEGLISSRGLSEYFDIERDRIYCTTTGSEWAFIGLHNEPEKVKSFNDFDEAWIEEAQTISHESLRALLPTIRKPNSRVIFTMNRLTDADPVYQMFTETPPPRTLVKYLDPLTLDRYGLQPKEMQELRDAAKGDPDYAYIWLGEPLSQIDNAVLSRDELVHAFERDGDDTGAWEVGVDVARFGSDRTVFVARKGLSAKKIQVITKEPLTRQADFLCDFCEGLDARVKIDDTGVGGGLSDIARERGLNIVGVNFAQGAKQPDKYPNAASEMWFDFKSILCDINLKGIVTHRVGLLGELSQRGWSFDAKGRRVVEQKSAFKAAGNRSPDLADALLLAFYEPKPPHRIEW